MASVTLAELQAFARSTAGATHDPSSETGLGRALEEFRSVHREPIAPIRMSSGGTPYDSFFAALRDPAASFWDAELTVVDPPPAGRTWEWSFPFTRILFAADGSADVYPVGGGTPKRVMVRVLRRDYYTPRTEGGTEARPAVPGNDFRTGLLPLGPAVQVARRVGFVPFGVALLLYGADERYRVELDLIDSMLLRDPRAGQLPLSRRVRRTSRVSYDIDSFLARGELTVGNARVLEVLVESHGLTPFEVTQVFGGVREFGASALRTLAARGLATFERRTGVYRPRFDAFRRRPDGRPAEGSSFAPLPNPALRSSVMELLAAADSRATCPLCGDPLPPGPHGILCARCQAEVGSAE